MSEQAGRVVLRRLQIGNFRNIDRISFEPAPRLNLIAGDNGQGKTSVIEALYVLSTTRSFRTGRLLEVIEQGHERAYLRAQVASLGLNRDLAAEIGARSKTFQLDGKKPKRKLDYALSTPVIAFHPGDLLLASGPAGVRRALLDRVLVYLDPGGAEARLRYQEASRERQRLLAERGIQARELDAYETVLAAQGARFALGRRRAAEELLGHLGPTFARMGPTDLELQADYRPGGHEDPAVFLHELQKRRPQDQRRGVASFGPQKDEIELVLGGRPLRSHGSQGQQRIVTLALKVAELHGVREVTRVEPMLLLDDVSSELDQARTTAVFRFLRDTKSQVFVTTTRPELFRDVELEPSERSDFRMVRGALEVL